MVGRAGRSGLRRNWTWILADGVVGIVIGILALVYPRATITVIALLLGIGLLVQGLFELFAALGADRGAGGRTWAFVLAVIALIAGITVLVHPGAGVFAIVLGVALWLLVAGINELWAAFRLRERRGWNLVAGVVSLACGVVFLLIPGLAISTAAVVAGVLFIVRGVVEVGLAANLRSLTA